MPAPQNVYITVTHLFLHGVANFESFDSNGHPPFVFAEHLSATHSSKGPFSQLTIEHNVFAWDLPLVQCQAVRVVGGQEAQLFHAFMGGSHFGIIPEYSRQTYVTLHNEVKHHLLFHYKLRTAQYLLHSVSQDFPQWCFKKVPVLVWLKMALSGKIIEHFLFSHNITK